MATFAELGVRPRTLAALEAQGITEPNEVQAGALPPILQGRDCVISAPTGSGKTLAFLLPLIERLQGRQVGGARAIIVTPTRELATQISAVLQKIDPKLLQALIYGGVGYAKQIASLRSADVIIGCPGRIVDLMNQGPLRLNSIEYLVLDEADEMLEVGFAKDIEKIISATPQRGGAVRRQTVLASATMPAWVQRMIEKHLQDPARVSVALDAESSLEHGILRIPRGEKVAILSKLLKAHGSAIVFHRTKHGTAKLARDLQRLGHSTAELQGNLSQNARDRAIGLFRKQHADVLIATNVAARGLDISHVSLVVNYELPDTPQWLTHRIGRTARNGAEGRALTFLTDDDTEQWRKLRRLGAPELKLVDSDRLFETGEMHFLDTPVINERANANSSRRTFRPRTRGGAMGRRPMARAS